MSRIPATDHGTAINRFNATDDATTLGHCIHRLLEKVTENHFNKVALICSDRKLTFRELNSIANRFARLLVKKGIRRGDLVGIALDRSVDLVTVLLGVLKTGAAYVPIDPSFPAERIGYMLDDAKPKLVIVEASTQDVMSFWEGDCLAIEEARKHTATSDFDTTNLHIDVLPDDLAYVIFTSGSTGKPKGVEINHSALSNLLLSMKQEPGCNETDRLLAITTISFDIAVLELLLPLLCGATTVVAETHDAKDPCALLRLIQNHSITVMQGTPVTWQMLLDAGWSGEPHLCKILCGGDALPRRLAERLLLFADSVWNMYGPTEATVWASTWRVRQDCDVVIGQPIANYQLYVLDENLSLVLPGHEGELYIGGAGLAKGYHNKPDLTRSRFLDNPFHEGLLYQTGDLARFDAPDKLSVLGRADGQVKVRGHRIELSDIEAAITSNEEVSDAVVISKDDRLVAYCVRDGNCSISGHKGKLTLDNTLRLWLAERLPSYMMPAFYVELDVFPMTLNSKIDRKALPDPIGSIQPATAMPMTKMEYAIKSVWSNILGHDRFGIHDNFFQIGGDSIRVIRVGNELEKVLNQTVSLAKIFEHYTIRALAAYLTGAEEKEANIHSVLPKHHLRDNESIAVVSMACRLPGGVTTPEEYFELLDRGDDVITDVPKTHWDTDLLFDINLDARGKLYCRKGGFLSSVDDFDASFFGISPKEARAMDPAQRIMLETCWEGFERGGYTMEQLRGSQTGVYIGISNISAHSSSPGLEDLDGYALTGSAGGTMSGRISYALGLEGPALTVDTACSSSLVTTHLACNALHQGECDIAVSGGVTLLLTPGMHVEFSRLKGISEDGRCRAFSVDANGTGWAEGCTVVVLKRLGDAVRDGDLIHAVLRGTAVNHGGRSAGLTVPSMPAQQRLIRTALTTSKLTPGDIDYVEAHGTGTKLGDPIEGAALAAVFGGNRSPEAGPLWIGSSKSNIGHTQAAAGLAGMLKVILAMRKNKLPRTLHADKPTLAINWKTANMALVQKSMPWLSRVGRPRRAGISAFGIGGTNAHAIVEEPPLRIVDSEPASGQLPPEIPFLLSADTDAALYQQVEKLQIFLGRTSQDHFCKVAYSLATTRTHFRRRLVFLAKDKATLLEKLSSVPKILPAVNVGEPRLAMLFTGQGSQVPGMGKDLYEVYPTFRDALNEIAAYFPNLDTPLIDVMHAPAGSGLAALLRRTDFAQPAIFALEVALWHLWRSWGVQPDVVLGHSVGELAVAHISGILDLPGACRLVAARGRLMQAIRVRGSMVALGASADEVTRIVGTLGLAGKVEIAGYNTPTQTVASGDAGAIEEMIAYMVGNGIKAKSLDVSHAFHSHHMDVMLEAYQEVAKSMKFHPPQIPIVSSLTGKLAEVGQFEQPGYWAQQARRPVLFSDGMQILHQQGVNTFIELGSKPALSGMGASCLPDETISWIPSLIPNKHGASIIQRSLLDLHIRRVPVNWKAYFDPFGCCQRIELPTYAFQREHFPPLRKLAFNNHSLSSAKADVANFQFEISWKTADTINVIQKGLWGLICHNGEVTWAGEIKRVLARAGIQLQTLGNFEDSKGLDGVLCLWDSDNDDVICQATDLIGKALLQLQMAARMQFPFPLVWVTRNAVGAGAEDNQTTGLGAGPLWGLMRTARSEHPELHLRLIDLEENTAPDALTSALMLSAEPECALRNTQVLVPRIQRINLVSDSNIKRLLRTDGAVLITGGLGDLGQRVAKWLVMAHGIKDVVLVSRHGMKAPEGHALIAELDGLGGKATVIACDIAKFDSIKSVMAIFDGNRPLRGVVHAAGVVDDGVLSSLTPEKCATTFGPKVNGAWHLHQLTRNMDLDIFVMLSSISGVMGMPGHGNYAAANTFLDALAHLRRSLRLPATSVAYGTWKGQGMAAKLHGTTRTRLTQLGLDPLSGEEGLELFEQAVRSGRSLTLAAALDPNRLQGYFEEQGGMPPLFTLLLDQYGGRVHRNRGLREVLSNTSSEHRADIMLRAVRETMAKALGFASPNDIDVHRPLQDVGIDSLTAVLMRNQLANLTDLTLAATFTFQHPNVEALSQFLLSELQKDKPPVPEAAYINIASVRKGCLDSSFTFDNAASVTSPRSVFITGATGFVGAFILHELLNQGITSHCLVRADNTEQAKQRLLKTLTRYDLWKPEYTPLLQPVAGDMSQTFLGLPQDTFNDLADRVDAICHSGALVDWMRPLENYVGPNIVSTHEVLRLASCGRSKAVHLVSTMSTIPKYLGNDLTEEDREYGYSTSKYMAERMVSAARWRGAKASVYRLPFVTASSTSGHFRSDRGDFLHNLIAGSLELGAFPFLDAKLSAVVPVDYLSKTIVAVMTQDLHRIGKDYDFSNKHAPSFSQFFELMSAVSEKHADIIQFSRWREHALEYAAVHPTSSLARIATLFDGHTDNNAAEMVEGPPVGDHVFGGNVYPVPVVDKVSVGKYLGHIGALKVEKATGARASKHVVDGL